MLDANLQITLQPRVGTVHNLVYRIGRGWGIRVGLVVAVQLVADFGQPCVQQRMLAFAFTRVQRRKRADYAGLTLRNDQFRNRDDEQRRGNERDAQAAQSFWQVGIVAGHGMSCLHIDGEGATKTAPLVCKLQFLQNLEEASSAHTTAHTHGADNVFRTAAFAFDQGMTNHARA